MIIDATFSNNMTRSIPPQAQAYQITIVQTEQARPIFEGRLIRINTEDNIFMATTADNPFIPTRFNVKPETIILGHFGIP